MSDSCRMTKPTRIVYLSAFQLLNTYSIALCSMNGNRLIISTILLYWTVSKAVGLMVGTAMGCGGK